MKKSATYIKNHKEVTRKGLSYYLFGQKEIYQENIYDLNTLKLVIAEDIELLHLRNFEFANFKVFFECLNKDTLLILDHCKTSRYLTIKGGNVIIDTPQFDDPIACVAINESENAQIILEENKAIKKSLFPYSKYRYEVCNAKNLHVTGTEGGHSHIYIDSMNTATVRINDSKKIEIGVHKGSLEVDNSSDISLYMKNPFGISNLSVKDSIVLLVGDDKLDLCNAKVEFKNSSIFAKMLRLPNGVYTPIDGMLSFSDDSLGTGDIAVARANLISCLKTVEEKVNDICEKDMREISDELEIEYDRILEPLLEKSQESKRYKQYDEPLITDVTYSFQNIESDMDRKAKVMEKILKKQKVGKIIS